jgi:hypothetical protein
MDTDDFVAIHGVGLFVFGLLKSVRIIVGTSDSAVDDSGEIVREFYALIA